MLTLVLQKNKYCIHMWQYASFSVLVASSKRIQSSQIIQQFDCHAALCWAISWSRYTISVEYMSGARVPKAARHASCDEDPHATVQKMLLVWFNDGWKFEYHIKNHGSRKHQYQQTTKPPWYPTSSYSKLYPICHLMATHGYHRSIYGTVANHVCDSRQQHFPFGRSFGMANRCPRWPQSHSETVHRWTQEAKGLCDPPFPPNFLRRNPLKEKHVHINWDLKSRDPMDPTQKKKHISSWYTVKYCRTPAFSWGSHLFFSDKKLNVAGWSWLLIVPAGNPSVNGKFVHLQIDLFSKAVWTFPLILKYCTVTNNNIPVPSHTSPNSCKRIFELNFTAHEFLPA